MKPIAASALRVQAWANGAGTTTVIASGPDEDRWQWRLSLAEISQACVFSRYPGTRRQLAPLDAPLQLRFDDGRQLDLLRLVTAHFDGADAAHAALPDGPTRAFNLMLRGDAQGELLARPLNGSMWLPARAGWRWLVHALSGQVTVLAGDRSLALPPAHSLWLDGPHGERMRLEGGGEVVLVQLRAS